MTVSQEGTAWWMWSVDMGPDPIPWSEGDGMVKEGDTSVTWSQPCPWLLLREIRAKCLYRCSCSTSEKAQNRGWVALLKLVLLIHSVSQGDLHHWDRPTMDCCETADTERHMSHLKMGVRLTWSSARMTTEGDEPVLCSSSIETLLLHKVGSEYKLVQPGSDAIWTYGCLIPKQNHMNLWQKAVGNRTRKLLCVLPWCNGYF